MNVKLPGFVIADLYKNNIVITGDAAIILPQTRQVQVTENVALPNPPPAQTEQKKWYLGNNKKGIVVVAIDETAVFINDEWLDTLTKMLQGVQLNLGDTAIVNLHNHPVTFNHIKQQLNARYVIMFGVATAQLQLPFTIPHYQVQNYAGCTLLSAPAATLAGAAGTTESIKAEKRKLWESLKRMNF
jgi:hypothetical protein